MKLYLMRHGEALPDHIDHQRPLSEVGIQEVKKVATSLHLESCDIWHSPKLRAQQTAEIMAPNNPLILKATLMPNSSVEPTLNELLAQENDLLIVSHIPFVENLLFALNIKNLPIIPFQTATVVAVEKKEDQWHFLWKKDPNEFV